MRYRILVRSNYQVHDAGALRPSCVPAAAARLAGAADPVGRAPGRAGPLPARRSAGLFRQSGGAGRPGEAALAAWRSGWMPRSRSPPRRRADLDRFAVVGGGARGSGRHPASSAPRRPPHYLHPGSQTAASDEVVAFAREHLRPGRPLLAAAFDLASAIHRDFVYAPGATDVDTTAAQGWDLRRGRLPGLRAHHAGRAAIAGVAGGLCQRLAAHPAAAGQAAARGRRRHACLGFGMARRTDRLAGHGSHQCAPRDRGTHPGGGRARVRGRGADRRRDRRERRADPRCLGGRGPAFDAGRHLVIPDATKHYSRGGALVGGGSRPHVIGKADRDFAQESG